MSFAAFLNQTCTIKRPSKTGVDRYNANAYAESTIASDVPCRLVEKSVKIMNQQTSEYTWVKAKVLLLPATVSVLAKDTATLGSDVYLITQPLERQRGNSAHHVSCVVEIING